MFFLAYAISPNAAQVQGISTLPDPISIGKNLLWYFSRLITNAHWIWANLSDEPELWELGLGLLVCVVIFVWVLRGNFSATNWAMWSFFTILPFTHAPHFIISGPSRHLYLPSVGSSFVLAYLIQSLSVWIEKSYGRLLGKTIFGMLILGIVGSSFISLKRSEAILRERTLI